MWSFFFNIYTAEMIFCPRSKMDKYDCYGCITLYILSIVICTFVKHNIPLKKAHMICKMVNVQYTVNQQILAAIKFGVSQNKVIWR